MRRGCSLVLFTAKLATIIIVTPLVSHAQTVELLVSSAGADGVLRYNGQTGAFIDDFASGGGLDVPVGMSFGPVGNLYVASNSNSNILRYTGLTGVFIDTFIASGSRGLLHPLGLVFGLGSNCLVTQSSHRTLAHAETL